MKKILYILKEAFYLARNHKLYILLPILVILAILACLVYYIGPAVIISFIYAGV